MFLEALIENRLCLCVRRGGGGISSGRVYVHAVKFIGGIMSTLQNSWGDYDHVYKFEQGGCFPGWGGILMSYTDPLRSQTF